MLGSGFGMLAVSLVSDFISLICKVADMEIACRNHLRQYICVIIVDSETGCYSSTFV